MLALNEVFLGENLSARVSYLEVKLDEETEFAKTRNSGLCVSTGALEYEPFTPAGYIR